MVLFGALRKAPKASGPFSCVAGSKVLFGGFGAVGFQGFGFLGLGLRV